MRLVLRLFIQKAISGGAGTGDILESLCNKCVSLVFFELLDLSTELYLLGRALKVFELFLYTDYICSLWFANLFYTKFIVGMGNASSVQGSSRASCKGIIFLLKLC